MRRGYWLREYRDEIDMEQVVLERGVLHLRRKSASWKTRSKARAAYRGLQHLGFVLEFSLADLIRPDRSRVFLRDDRKLAPLRKAEKATLDAIIVLAGALDIIGRVTGAAVGGGLASSEKKAVETDGERRTG